MKKLLIYITMCFMLASLSTGLASCSSSPGVAPSPPTEIPAFLSFPATVTVGTGELPTSSVSAPPNVSKSTPADNYAIIKTGNTVAESNELLINAILDVFEGVKWPTCTDSITEETTGTNIDGLNYMQTSYCTQNYCKRTRTTCTTSACTANNSTILYLTFSGYSPAVRSGTAVTCSGTSAPVDIIGNCAPASNSNLCSCTGTQSRNICFRSWTSTNGATPERYLAGYFGDIPCTADTCPLIGRGSEENPGSGDYRVELISTETIDEHGSSYDGTYDVTQDTGVLYDQYDADNADTKSSDVAVNKDYDTVFSTQYHVIVDQYLSESDVLKELLVYADTFTDDTQPNDLTWVLLNYVSRFLEGVDESENYWRGTVALNGTDVIDNKCIQMWNGVELSSSNSHCEPLYRTAMPTMSSPTSDSYELPSNFPTTPCGVSAPYDAACP